MSKPYRITALVAMAFALAAVLLIPRLRTDHRWQSTAFILPAQGQSSFKDYISRLATFRPPSPGARPYGYLYLAGARPIPFYQVQSVVASSPSRR
jgi:hypothetical protein